MKQFYKINLFAIRLLVVVGVTLLSQTSIAQNSCAGAQVISAGTYVISEINGANGGACSTSTMAEWYAYTPTANYTVTVSSDLPVNICKDTYLNIYTGTCAGLVCFASDDDSGTLQCNSGNTNSWLSKETFDVTAGTTYYIAWENRYSAVGFTFTLTEAPYTPSPCAIATPITAGLHTVSAINGGNITTACSNATSAKWYSYTATAAAHITVSSDLVQNICKDTYFSVYTGSCTGGLTCITSDDNSGVINCNSGNTNSNLSVKTFDVAAGVTYYIVWDNKWSAAGFDFQLSESIIVVPVNYTTSTISTINSSYNICVVDMNGDGKDDIAGVSSNNLKVHTQGAPGVFTVTDYPISGSSKMPGWSLAAGDYNKDGFTDLMLGSGNGVTFWKSNSTGTAYSNVTPGEYIFCQRTNFVDINNDGHLDAFSCHDVDPNVYYINNGFGNFAYNQSGTTPGAYMLGITPSGGNYASLWTDFDNDGDSDLFISKCSGPPSELHRNDGSGVFTDISAIAQINVTPVQSWSSAIADFDNDGDMDILIGSNGSVKSMLFRNNLDTTNSIEEAYSNVTAGSGWDLDNSTSRDYVAYDFDNDGYVDILSGTGKIAYNNGDMTFSKINYPGLEIGAIGDLNNDGFLDIQNGNTIRYAVPNDNNWFKLNVHGIQSNSNGIGARVEIHGPFGTQIRDVRSGEGFEFMSTMNVHFGLGQSTSITSVIIKWPSGIVDTIQNPTINSILNVVEGSTLANNDFAGTTFSMYPNPTNDILNIKMGDNGAALESVNVFDLAGRLVAEPVLQNDAFSVNQLSVGTYIVLIKTVDGRQFTQKFLKN